MPPLDVDLLLRAVGRRMAELRVQAGVTQQALAEQVGLSVRYLQRIEAGTQNLTLRSLALLADSLGASLVDVLTMPSSMESRPGRPKKRAAAGVAAKSPPRRKSRRE